MDDFRTAFLEHVVLDSPDEVRLLDLACDTLAEITKMRKQIQRDGFTVSGSKAQPVAHPLLKEIRAHQAEFARIVKELSPTRGGTASRAGSALATRRWRQ